MSAELSETISSDTNSSVIGWDVGDGVFAAYGTFDTATAKLQVSFDDGTTWIDEGTSFTANGFSAFGPLPSAVKVRVNVSSTGASSSITVELYETSEQIAD